MTDRIERMQTRALHTEGIADTRHGPVSPEKDIGILPDSQLAFEPNSPEIIRKYSVIDFTCDVQAQNPLWNLAGNHGSCDYRTFLRSGLSYYKEQIQAAGGADGSGFLHDCGALCDEILAFAERYRRLAEDLLRSEPNETRRRELHRMAEALRRVPRYGATSFFEAVQSFWIAFYVFGDGVGRLDSYLNPFLEKDLRTGAVTQDGALELIEELFVKIFSVLGCGNPRSADNHMVIAGKPEGVTTATRLILRAVEELDTYRPQVTFRWYDGIAYEDLRDAVRVHMKKNDRVMFINDEVMIRGFERLGVQTVDACEYSLSGCSEAIITGMASMGSVEGFLNLMTPLLKSLEAAPETYDAFYSGLMLEVRRSVLEIMDISERLDRERSANDNPYQSLTIQNCIRTGKNYWSGGAKYNFCNWCLIGFCEFVDSVSVVKDLVFGRHLFTLTELKAALKADFIGYERLLDIIRSEGRFFGNDDDFADGIAVDFAERLHGFAALRTPFRGGKYNFGTLAGIENMHLAFGRITPATPDGRRAYESLAASLSVTRGKDTNGVTALLRSLAKIDYTNLPSSVVTNITLGSEMQRGEENADRVAQLIQGYFAMNGVQLQINYLSKEQLLDAQRHPEQYGSLRVRVTGYSGYFTRMTGELQDEIIRRTVVKGV